MTVTHADPATQPLPEGIVQELAEFEEHIKEFRRGDINATGAVDVTDAVNTIDYLFRGTFAPACSDAADSNDDGELDVADPVWLLNDLFSGGPDVPPPGKEDCGSDPTEDDLGCDDYPGELCGDG